jgi:predicted PurR-regulated permease PerM
MVHGQPPEGSATGRLDQVRASIRRAYESGRASVRGGRQNGDDADAPEATAGPAGPGDETAGTDRIDADADHPVQITYSSTSSRDDIAVPHGLRLAAAWTWRLLLLVIGASAIIWAMAQLAQVVIPVAIAMLLSALLSPAVGWLRRHGVHRTLSTALVLIGGVLLVAGTLTLVITQFVDNYSKLSQKTSNALDKIQSFLKDTLHLSDKQLSFIPQTALQWVKDHQESLTSGALNTATTALDVLAATFLVLFTTFFFLRDGDKIWRFLVGLLPRGAREPIGTAGVQSWRTLVAYVRATILVAFIDAVGIGIGLVILRVDLAFALAALVFLGAFIPIIGATLSGTIAVLVALVTHNPITALLVLAVVIGVQQLEGHVLQPLIMGRAVSIHPLAVILAIATGLVLAGIIGALVAVPIVAVLNTGIRHLAAHRAHRPDPPPPDAVVVADR